MGGLGPPTLTCWWCCTSEFPLSCIHPALRKQTREHWPQKNSISASLSPSGLRSTQAAIRPLLVLSSCWCQPEPASCDGNHRARSRPTQTLGARRPRGPNSLERCSPAEVILAPSPAAHPHHLHFHPCA